MTIKLKEYAMWTYLKKRSPANQNQVMNLQIFDLLQMSRHEKNLQKICLYSIHQFDMWKENYYKQENLKPSFIEGFVLKRRVKNSLHAYRTYRKNRMQAFSFYMNQLPAYTNQK